MLLFRSHVPSYVDLRYKSRTNLQGDEGAELKKRSRFCQGEGGGGGREGKDMIFSITSSSTEKVQN